LGASSHPQLCRSWNASRGTSGVDDGARRDPRKRDARFPQLDFPKPNPDVAAIHGTTAACHCTSPACLGVVQEAAEGAMFARTGAHLRAVNREWRVIAQIGDEQLAQERGFAAGSHAFGHRCAGHIGGDASSALFRAVQADFATLLESLVGHWYLLRESSRTRSRKKRRWSSGLKCMVRSRPERHPESRYVDAATK